MNIGLENFKMKFLFTQVIWIGTFIFGLNL